MARMNQEAGFTQPREHSLADICTVSELYLGTRLLPNVQHALRCCVRQTQHFTARYPSDRKATGHQCKLRAGNGEPCFLLLVKYLYRQAMDCRINTNYLMCVLSLRWERREAGFTKAKLPKSLKGTPRHTLFFVLVPKEARRYHMSNAESPMIWRTFEPWLAIDSPSLFHWFEVSYIGLYESHTFMTGPCEEGNKVQDMK